MKKHEMIKAMVSYYTDGNKAAYARLLGVPPQTLSSWESRNIFDAELIYRKCKDISAKWLLSGEGEMLDIPHETKTQILKVGKDANGNFLQGDGNSVMLPETSKDIEILEVKVNDLSAENERLKKDIEDLRFTKDKLLTAITNLSNK